MTEDDDREGYREPIDYSAQIAAAPPERVAYIRGLYRGSLGREPMDAEIWYWLNSI